MPIVTRITMTTCQSYMHIFGEFSCTKAGLWIFIIDFSLSLSLCVCVCMQLYVLNVFIDIQTSKELIQMDTDKMMTYGTLTMDDEKLTQS